MSELSTKRFFPVTLRSNSIDDELRMEFQFVGEIEDGQWEKWLQRLSETFLALARAGGLGGKRHAPRIRDTFLIMSGMQEKTKLVRWLYGLFKIWWLHLKP